MKMATCKGLESMQSCRSDKNRACSCHADKVGKGSPHPRALFPTQPAQRHRQPDPPVEPDVLFTGEPKPAPAEPDVLFTGEPKPAPAEPDVLFTGEPADPSTE